MTGVLPGRDAKQDDPASGSLAVTNEAPPSAHVTVFIPTYNRAPLVRRAIASVLAQTHTDLDVVVADNASTDDTEQVVRQIEDPRVSYVRHPTNTGALGNFTWCLERAREAQFVKIMTDDDELHPESVSRTLAVLLAHPEVGLVHTAFDRLDPSDEPLLLGINWTRKLDSDTIETGAEFIREAMRTPGRVDISSALFRAEAIPACGWVPEDFPAIDLGLWMRMARDWDMAFLAASLVRSRIQASGVSAEAQGEFSEGGYRANVPMARKLLELKQRFIEESGDRLEDPEGLLRLARRCFRRDLVSSVRDSTLPERKLSATLRGLGPVIRMEPGVLLQRRLYVDLALSAIGGRGAERLKTGVRRMRSGSRPSAAARSSGRST